jgi:hypothetical protein
MSKKLTSKQKKEQLNQLFAAYNRRLGMLYSGYVKKLLSLGYNEDVPKVTLFSILTISLCLKLDLKTYLTTISKTVYYATKAA